MNTTKEDRIHDREIAVTSALMHGTLGALGAERQIAPGEVATALLRSRERNTGHTTRAGATDRSRKSRRFVTTERERAVAVVLECKGAALDQYDQVLGEMGRTPRGRDAPGSLFHWVTVTQDGIRVTDVWQTRAQFEPFAAEQIGPLTVEVGFPAPPEIAFHDVHNYDFAGGSA